MSRIKSFLNTIGIEQIKDNGEFITQTEYNMLKKEHLKLGEKFLIVCEQRDQYASEIERLKRINKQKAERIKRENRKL